MDTSSLMNFTAASDLSSLLHRTFGFAHFRANQEAVCAAAVEGRDVLLVMPTGAGKSLCYQLPALARGGTALVISPLIALMEDQATKLSALGLKVGRIHSGLDRETARQTCREYLDGTLQFLFIAPERLRVPGFTSMLAKRPLSLIAIDEAHCISQWGHDFRPDYRTLGQHLPALRPAPVMALTATATPEVQRDIVAQLGLEDTARFIHGFRRTNLAVEVVEVPKPLRHGKTLDLLSDPANRPAIVYAPSRKDAELLATELSAHFPAAAYHAGLESSLRQSVQHDFLQGAIDVVVATVAFGMGIDKANVRTVVHIAAPSSVESYYQEIGRAGRDGKPSRSVLMYSYLDRKTHEFLLERAYPPIDTLTKIEKELAADTWIFADELRMKTKLGLDDFAPAMDRLIAQGVATMDMEGNVSLVQGSSDWKRSYETQINFRRSQMDRMMQFAGSSACRMDALTGHFGDHTGQSCGLCDVCAPENALAQDFRAPNAEEERLLQRMLGAVTDRGISVRKLQEALGAEVDRREAESMLDALTRAGYITVEEAEFCTSGGETVRYRKACWTHEGREWQGGRLEGILLRDQSEPLSKAKAPRTSRSAQAEKASEELPLTSEQSALAEKLRAWRLDEAKAMQQRAFFILSDRVMHEIARQMPNTMHDLLAIRGMGPAKVERWGEAICAVVKAHEATPAKA